MRDREFNLPIYDIVVTVTKDYSGSITSNLSHELNDDDTELIVGVDIIESMILAHAVAGIDISTPKYLEGIEVVVDRLFNTY